MLPAALLVWIKIWSEVLRPGKIFAQIFTEVMDPVSFLELSVTNVVQNVRSWPSFSGYCF